MTEVILSAFARMRRGTDPEDRGVRDAAHVLIGLVVWFASACVATPTSPTSGPAFIEETVTVGVHVLQFGSHDAPLSGVTVRVDQQVAGQTDAEGFAAVQVVPGVPVTISVELAGYRGFGAEGTVWGASESWRFWLEPVETELVQRPDAAPTRDSRTSRASEDRAGLMEIQSR